ncbi:MAG: rhomboid family intramembrane serine protease [Planctomycetaceae bacterium]
MLVPLYTDAPLYYRPWGTIGLIVANCITFGMTAGGATGEGWWLTYGNGLHPTEWLLSAFLHAGPMHLIGNMVMLWAFGHVSEGKLGWHRFVPLYFLLCLISGMIEQAIMLGYDTEASGMAGSAGASGVIFGLVAMAMIWAPENCIEMAFVYMFFGFPRVAHFEIRIWVYAIWSIIWEILIATLLGWGMNTPTLHLLGGAVGATVGIVMLKKKWVDCEGWDLFSVWRGDHHHAGTGHYTLHRDRDVLTSTPNRAVQDDVAPKRESPRKVRNKVLDLIEQQRFLGAWKLYQQYRDVPAAQIDAPPLKQLADGLIQLQEWAAGTAVLQEFLGRFEDKTGTARLILAGLLVRHRNRPQAALKLIDSLSDTTLDPKNRDLAEKIRHAAERLVDEGHLELSDGPSALED